MFQKYPFYKQLESMDCGPACLKMIFQYYKRNIDISLLKEMCNTSRMGVNISDISEAAKELGLNTLLLKTTQNYLIKKQPLPCILHWRQNHFVVLFEANEDNFTIGDPAHGIITLTKEVFAKEWSNFQEKGVALFLEPTAKLVDSSLYKETEGGFFKQLIPLLDTHIKPLFYLLLTISVATILSFIMPKSIQYMIDKGVNAKNIHIIIQVLCFQFMVFLSIALSNLMRGLVQTNLSTRLGVQIISTFLHKLLRLPISFFDSKNHSDIYQRIQDHSLIESFLSYRIIQFIFACALLIIYSIQLFLFDYKLLIVFFLLTAISFIWFFLFLHKRKEYDYERFSLAAQERNNLMDLIAGMKEIKINNAQERKVNQWQKVQMKVYELRLKSLKLTQIQQVGTSSINHIKSLTITFLCAYSVIKSDLSFGMLLSVSYILGQLNGPIDEFIQYFTAHQDALLSLRRLNEIQYKKDENNANKHHFPSHFQHGFSLSNVSFKYIGSYNQYVLEDLNLFIPKGKTTAIVGTSGSGKTTLIKLLLAFYAPQIGKISLDGINLTEINSDKLREHCGVVMQDGYIYSGSIAENVALAEEEYDISLVKQALQVACLVDFVESLPLKYDTKIGNIGVELSGGQKQRLLIARAVYKNPEIIFFDEATSSLDSNTEKEIMQNLDTFFEGKTAIVIAHRLSTVKKADQIIVLKNGKIAEQGTHYELVQNRQDYYELVKNQLELEK